jgi:glycosyltransferase involved in cell wall biosynthesis
MISVDPARPLPPRPAQRVPRIGALGRFDRVKGFDVYIAALGELKSQGVPFEALLGGAGVEEQALLSRVCQAGLTDRLELPGWVTEVGPFLAGLDVLVVPARSDAFGLTPLQAAVAGVPLVLSRASGHREMFAEETEALFCDIEDSLCTARQIARIVQQPALAEQLRQGALARVIAQYSELAVSAMLLQAIDNIVKNNISNAKHNIIDNFIFK